MRLARFALWGCVFTSVLFANRLKPRNIATPQTPPPPNTSPAAPKVPVATPHQERPRGKANPLLEIEDKFKMESQPESCQNADQIKRISDAGWAAVGAYRTVNQVNTEFSSMESAEKAAAKRDAVEKLRLACGHVMRATGDAGQIRNAFKPLDPKGKEIWESLMDPSGTANRACQRVMRENAIDTIEVEKTEILDAMKSLDELLKAAVVRVTKSE